MFFDRNVVVLGAGLSGLGFAREISSSKIYEAKTHPGGHAFSTEVEGVFFDEGAHISHTKNQRFVDLITKETDYALMSRCNVGNFDRGKWLGYPVQNHLVALPMGQRLKILKELIGAQFGRRGQSCKNYHEWCLDQYGETLTTAYYKRYTEKYWRR
ncbi:MAG: protoporphyrinogen oxidase [Candidatus Marinamargulisbacteria bacterium]|jgi:protoporphyrinogen oxidase